MSFQKKSEFKYVTKNTPHEELLLECKRLKNYVCQLKYKRNTHREGKKEVRTNWKKKYDKLRYQVFKNTQLVWAKDRHIERLRNRNKAIKAKNKKTGYNEAMKRIRVNHYKVKHVANFLMKTNVVMGIYSLDIREYAFLLWAGRFDFFNKKDFELTMEDVDINFYSTVNKLIKRNYINLIAKKTGEARKIFALTGIGIDAYNKIAKFTNKHLTSESIRNRVQDSREASENRRW